MATTTSLSDLYHSATNKAMVELYTQVKHGKRSMDDLEEWKVWYNEMVLTLPLFTQDVTPEILAYVKSRLISKFAPLKFST